MVLGSVKSGAARPTSTATTDPGSLMIEATVRAAPTRIEPNARLLKSLVFASFQEEWGPERSATGRLDLPADRPSGSGTHREVSLTKGV